VQEAVSDLVQAETRLKQALKEYDKLLKDIDEQLRGLDGELDLTQETINITQGANKKRTDLMIAARTLKGVQVALNRGADLTDDLADSIAEAIPKNFIAGGFVIGGLACGGGVVVGGDIAAPARGAVKGGFSAVANTVFGIGSDVAEIAINGLEGAIETTDMQSGLDITKAQLKFEHQQSLKEIASMMREEAPMRLEIYNQKEVVQQANAMVGLPNKGTLSTQVEALFEAVAVPDLKRLAAEKAQAEREQAEKAKVVKGAAVIMPGDIQPGFSGGW
jgi:uncharacterized protein YoxC